MLFETDLLGRVHDKVVRAVEIAKAFEPPEGYFFAYSGGKDSVVTKAILDMAGVKYDTHYSVTTVDPPELVHFIISQFDTVIYNRPDGTQTHFRVVDGRLRKTDSPDGQNVVYFELPKIPMNKLIVKKMIPPTRLARYCCAELKEVHGEGRITVTGTRWAESRNRKNNQGQVTITSGKAAKVAEDNGANFIQTNRGGGGAELRRFTHAPHCGTVLPYAQDPCQSHHSLRRG